MDIASLPLLEEEPDRVRMESVTGYAQVLRALGQALETINLGDFTVEPDGDGYRVAGTVSVIKNARDLWAVDLPTRRARAMELSYSRSDVERLEREGRIRRATVHGTADSSRLSHALRVIGNYLTQKYSRLVRLSRKGESFEVDYESSLGSRYRDQFSAAELYDLWARFYLQRSIRTAS